MRVISGKYKGKNLLGFNINGTRPTMDRVKESLFGTIQNYVKDSVCLDLFAGSGSLGIEALSNFASKCFFVDNNIEVIKVLNENTKDMDNAIIIKNNYKDNLINFKNSNTKFDLIFLDPPYDLHLINDATRIILENDLLKKDGLLILEYESEEISCPLKNIKEKKYGNKYISIYKNI